MKVVNKDNKRDLFDISVSEIKDACCSVFEVSKEDFDNIKVCTHVVCSSRQAFWMILRKTKPTSLGLIGEQFDRGRWNIQTGIKSFKKKMKEKESVKMAFLSIGKTLNAPDSIKKIAEEVLDGK